MNDEEKKIADAMEDGIIRFDYAVYGNYPVLLVVKNVKSLTELRFKVTMSVEQEQSVRKEETEDIIEKIILGGNNEDLQQSEDERKVSETSKKETSKRRR